MSTTTSVTLTIASAQEKNKIITAYKKYEKPATNEYIEYLFVMPSCRITLYSSGKILFQGIDAENESNRWQTNQSSSIDKKSPINNTRTFEQFDNYVGCDETGVGDYFAPLVACAAFINSDIIKKIKDLNIKDSKQLTDSYIMQIAPSLKKLVPYALITLSNEHYNQFIENGMNSHVIKVFVHQQALIKLFATTTLDKDTPIIMDAFTSSTNYKKYLQKINIPKLQTVIPTHFEQKAENKYLGVAVASIIGRAHFLEQMQLQNQTYATVFPLGAGKHVDTFAQQFLANTSIDTYKKLVKWHFANTQRIV